MSNCIELDNPVLRIPVHAIDIDKVKMFIALGDSVTIKHKWDELSLEQYITYWFFNSRNVQIIGDEVEIQIGRAKSSHTWRDFRGLITSVIKPCMKEDFTYTFLLRDEYDGFKRVERYTINLKDPKL